MAGVLRHPGAAGVGAPVGAGLRAGARRRRRRARAAGAAPIVAGRDVGVAAPLPEPRRVHLLPAAIVVAGAVCAALLLVALRMDSIRLRYQLADAVRAEQALLDRQRLLTVEVRHLRHPLRLEQLGRELGLGVAPCVIDLARPAPCREGLR